MFVGLGWSTGSCQQTASRADKQMKADGRVIVNACDEVISNCLENRV